MNQHDELAQDIRAVDGSHSLGAGELAERLTERGWSRPRVVETIEELEALPVGSVVRDRLTEVHELFNDGWVECGYAAAFDAEALALPATVLYLPEEKP